MITLKELIQRENKRINKLPVSKQENAKKELKEWICCYSIAKQLDYPKGVIERILNADNIIQVNNIMVDARRNAYEI